MTIRVHTLFPDTPCPMQEAKLRPLTRESLVPRPPPIVTRRAFSLVEILVTVALMSVIVLGLLAMFNQTQRAFRSSMTQTDVLEAGRAVMDLLTRELAEMSPYRLNDINSANFYTWYIPRLPNPPTPLTQELPGSAELRSNVLQEFFFLTRSNQYWSGIGYLVSTPALGVGTLYRFDTNAHDSQPDVITNFSRYFQTARLTNLHRVADGIIHLRLRAFGANGDLIAPIGTFTNLVNATSRWDVVPDEIQYWFYGNAVPAYLDVELGILETQTYERFRSMEQTPAAAREFLEKQAGRVHLFRQLVPVRDVDRSVYR